MKILSCSDIHLDNRNPKYRTGEYENEIFAKLEWLVDYAIDNGIMFITISGDIFDKTGVPFSTINRLCKTFYKFLSETSGNRIITTFGQHDIRFHNPDFSNTPYGILVSAGIFTHVSEIPFQLYGTVKFYGAGWNETPKIPKSKGKNILLVHELTFKELQGQIDRTQYSLGSETLKRYKNADLILVGDNHRPFIVKKGKRKLINCGSICRKTKSELKYKPCVYVINTGNNSVEKIRIPVLKSKKVFNLKQIKIDEKKQDVIDESQPLIEDFTKMLKESGTTKPNFEKNLNKLLSKGSVSKAAKETVLELMITCTLLMEGKNKS